MARVCASAAILLAVCGAARGQATAADKYPFAVPPLEVVDRLAKADLGPVAPVPPEDRAFLEAAWKARLTPAADRKPPAEKDVLRAMLLASGVSDPADRDRYAKRYEALAADAEKAVAGARTTREKADKLLRFLHAGVMAKGYAEGQTTLPGVFDTGKYNCVSSAALYHLVGTRLGLELKVILIPGGIVTAGHATLDLVDGKERVQVEPTNPDGFDWATKKKQPGVLVLGVEPDRKEGYEADALGLAASTASNRGTSASKADPPRPAEAVRWYAVALCLHPGNRTASHNLVGALSNWGLRLSDAGKHEDAVRLYALAADVAPADKDLSHNCGVAWSRYIDAELDAGHDETVLKLVARAAAAVPAERDFRDPAEWFVRAARRARKAGGLEAGLAVADRGLKALPAAAGKDLRRWKASAYRLRSQELLDKGEVDGSLKVLAGAVAASPGDKELLAGVKYHTVKALEFLSERKGREAAVTHYRAVRAAFPKDREVAEAGVAYAEDVVDKLADRKKFAEAVEAAGACRPFAEDKADEVVARAYDLWGRHLAGGMEWEAAVAKYAEGLKACPKSDLLTTNAAYTVYQWAKPAVERGDWKEAARVCEVGLKYFPGNSRLEEARKVYRDRAGK